MLGEEAGGSASSGTLKRAKAKSALASRGRRRMPLGVVSSNVRRGAGGSTGAAAAMKKIKKKQKKSARAANGKKHDAPGTGTGLFATVSNSLSSRPLKLKRGTGGKKVPTEAGGAMAVGEDRPASPPRAPSCNPKTQSEVPALESVQSSPSSSVEDPMVCAKRLILEAKSKSKSSNHSDWKAAVDLYTEARDLLPCRLGEKLDRKIRHLLERIEASKSPSQLEESIKRAKTLIVNAKALSKSSEHADWTRAMGLYGEARDLLPPHLGNKLTRKISILQVRVTEKIDELKRKKIATPVPDPLDDLLSDDLVDFFAEFRPA